MPTGIPRCNSETQLPAFTPYTWSRSQPDCSGKAGVKVLPPLLLTGVFASKSNYSQLKEHLWSQSVSLMMPEWEPRFIFSPHATFTMNFLPE